MNNFISSPRSRTVRIEDTIWIPFSQKAKSFGLSTTAYLKLILQKTNQEFQSSASLLEKTKKQFLQEGIQESIISHQEGLGIDATPEFFSEVRKKAKERFLYYQK